MTILGTAAGEGVVVMAPAALALPVDPPGEGLHLQCVGGGKGKRRSKSSDVVLSQEAGSDICKGAPPHLPGTKLFKGDSKKQESCACQCSRLQANVSTHAYFLKQLQVHAHAHVCLSNEVPLKLCLLHV